MAPVNFPAPVGGYPSIVMAEHNESPKKPIRLMLVNLWGFNMTLEELITEKRKLASQIQKLVQEFEYKYKCHAEIQQNCTAVLYSQTPRTLAIEVEVRL